MLPAEWSLKVPAGIDGEVTRGIVGLLGRWDELEIERVLAWHLDSVVLEALPQMAASMGVDRVAYVVGPSRELVRRAVDLMRRRGTWEAMHDALAAVGYEDTEARESAMWRYDGEATYEGLPWRYGADSHWAKFWVLVRTSSVLAAEQVREVWDVIDAMRPMRAQLAILQIVTDAVPAFYLARP